MTLRERWPIGSLLGVVARDALSRAAWRVRVLSFAAIVAALAALPAMVGAQEGDAPTISGLSPTSGSAGTVVTITGTNFAAASAVTVGGVTAQFTVDSPTQIHATVPAAATSGPVVVVAGTRRATSLVPFTILPPAITSVSPATAAVGADVTITGTQLAGATEVRFGSAVAQFTVVSGAQINTKVPSAAASGPITVVTSGGTGTSATTFAIQPTLTQFAPATGEADARITLTGSGFIGALEVTIGGVLTFFSIDSPTQITVLVPPDAQTGRIVVSVPSTAPPAPGGPSATASSASTFAVLPRITGFTPTSGPPGTVVTITGSNFRGATGVTLGPAGAPFNVISPMLITATVPPVANTGLISVRTPSGQSVSTATFTFVTSGVLGEFEERDPTTIREIDLPDPALMLDHPEDLQPTETPGEIEGESTCTPPNLPGAPEPLFSCQP